MEEHKRERPTTPTNERRNTKNKGESFMEKLSNMPTPPPSYLLIGFLIVAFVSAWQNLQQARVIDSYGDVVAIQAERVELERLEVGSSETLTKQKKGSKEYKLVEKNIERIQADITKLRNDAKEEATQVPKAAAGTLNGSCIWTLIMQIGAAAFGVGVIAIICNKSEQAITKGAAIIVIGGLVIYMLTSRSSMISTAEKHIPTSVISK